jgi:ATP phosphoribosyltransferase regulatory subunit
MVPRERFQCGLELLGQPEAAADAEVLSLASRALDSVGLGENVVRLSVGTTAYFAAILDHLGASKRLAHQLRDCIDRKDRAGTSALLNEVPSGTARDALAFLAAPEAQSSVLEVARRLAPNDEARAAIDRLTEVAVAARGLGDRLEIDLGEVRGLGYYTGLVFNIYAAGAPGPVGGGGRYDSLLARFGDSRPAVGFSIDLDAIAPLAMLEAR